MDIKLLFGMVGKPWFIEPQSAAYYSQVLQQFLQTGATPIFDNRSRYEGVPQIGNLYRVDYNGQLNPKGNIQVYVMDAPLAKNDYCGQPGSKSFITAISSAENDPTITGHLFYIDAPGGQVAGTENLANTIKSAKKPTVTYCENIMASAHYWVGSSSDVIVADGSNNGWTGVIGSIGTMSTFYDDSQKLKNEGVAEHLILADGSNDKLKHLYDLRAGNYTDTKKRLNGMNETFHNAVKANRGEKLRLDKENVLTGKLYNVTEALEYGLIDQIGDFQSAVKVLSKLSINKITENNKNMSSNAAFQTTLTVTNTESFQPVEGGFLATEEQLNAIEAKLDEQAASIKALVTVNKEMEAKLASSNIEQLQTELTEAKSSLTKLEAANTELEAKLKAANEAKGLFLGGDNNGEVKQDAAGAHEETSEADEIANLPHNKAAAKYLETEA